MSKRQIFFSFRFKYDAWRAGIIRNMDKVSEESTFSDNDWEKVKDEHDSTIKKWIDDEMKMRSCVIVLIGRYSSDRKWIDYEIEHAWKCGKGIVAIRIHKLKDSTGNQTDPGHDPLSDFVIDTTINYIAKRSTLLQDEKKLSSICKTYNPPYQSSTGTYNYIKEHISDWIEEAIEIRNRYPK